MKMTRTGEKTIIDLKVMHAFIPILDTMWSGEEREYTLTRKNDRYEIKRNTQKNHRVK